MWIILSRSITKVWIHGPFERFSYVRRNSHGLTTGPMEICICRSWPTSKDQINPLIVNGYMVDHILRDSMITLHIYIKLGFVSYAYLIINFHLLVYPCIKCNKFSKNNVKIYNIDSKFWLVKRNPYTNCIAL